ncbi:MAG: hypothetical protein ACQKBU_12360 [Verrucomicrobiales bacterium]
MKPHLLYIGCGMMAIAAALDSLSAQEQLKIEVARKPGGIWTTRETRTLADLPPIEADPKESRFGGLVSPNPKPSGFFRIHRHHGRWWLIDPDGYPTIHRGITSVRPTRTNAAQKELQRKFGDLETWAAETAQLLRSHSFHGLGPWSSEELFRKTTTPMVYTKLWNFMAAYGKKRGGTYQKSGHRGYPGGCPFIFDPDFEEFCDTHAARLAATKDDPWLLGHFTDNELPWHPEMLNRYLELPIRDPGHQAARKWLEERNGKPALTSEITPDDQTAFVAFAADRYFSIVSKAIRKHDPNHLILGSRFHGAALRIPSLFEAAGRHIDVISLNYYHAWTPDLERLPLWSSLANKPLMITEWYAKAEDSGMGNTSGAGWLVRSQQDRGMFYQNFTLRLLESRVCVGWHWFRYSDNDPEQAGVDPSNLDANKGIVTSHYRGYAPLLQAMRELNRRTYGIARYFDQPRTATDN